MAERQLDLRGLECPQPVLRTREAMAEAGIDRVVVRVDSEVSVENISRLAQSSGWRVLVDSLQQESVLTLTPTAEAATPAADALPACSPQPASRSATVVLISSQWLGSGDDELGRILMRSFIKTLKELRPLPAKLLFLNSGVRLTTAGSDLLDDLRTLEEAGVAILSCGTCLDFFHLKDGLAIGRVTNMLEIATELLAAERLVRP